MCKRMTNTIKCYVIKCTTSDVHNNLYSYSEERESTRGRILIREEKETD